METSRVTPQEQAKVDRSIFESKAEAPKTSAAVSFEELTAGLSDEFRWMNSTTDQNKQVFDTAIEEIAQFQNNYKQENGALPSGRQTYIEFRKRIETDEPIDETSKAAVLLIDAVMDGDVRNGEFPVITESTPKPRNPYIATELFRSSTIDINL